MRETQRMRYRLRAMREGRTVAPGAGVSEPQLPRLPAAPLVAVVLGRIEAEKRRRLRLLEVGGEQPTGAREDVCASLGISPRTLFRWEGREAGADPATVTVDFRSVDAILLRLDLFWWEVWDQERLAEDHPVAAAWLGTT